jgi:hypothetical protein
MLILFYLLCVVGTYNYMKTVFGKDGEFSGLTPSTTEVLMTFIPLTNFPLAVWWLFGGGKKEKRNASKFFRIEK